VAHETRWLQVFTRADGLLGRCGARVQRRAVRDPIDGELAREILRGQSQPDRALQILEPLLDSIINDELWLQALLCEGEAPPRGLGARDRVMAL
jgi:hypothetical protein